MSEFSADRDQGLDVVRAFAILLVMTSHSRQTLAVPNDHLYLTFGGWYGVELFFVLSGFLIGTILLRSLRQAASGGTLLHFWCRRWLRTIPAYLAVLAFMYLVYGRFDWTYLCFLQGISGHGYGILPVSWSLTVEEWFYILLPLGSLALYRLGYLRAFVAAAGALALFSFCFRVWQFSAHSTELASYGTAIRNNTLRFDNIALGALLAAANEVWNIRGLEAAWKRRTQRVAALLFCMVFAIYEARLLGADPWPSWFSPVLYPCLTGVSAAALITALYATPPRLRGWPARVVLALSLSSYSLYLWHLLVMDWLRESGLPRGAALLALFFAASIAAAYCLYQLIERPFMKLRDHLPALAERERGEVRELRGQEPAS